MLFHAGKALADRAGQVGGDGLGNIALWRIGGVQFDLCQRLFYVAGQRVVPLLDGGAKKGRVAK